MTENAARPKCFIIMPITTPVDRLQDYGGKEAHFQHVMESLLIPAIEDAGMEPIKPLFPGSPVIQAKIIRHLLEAELVLCDMSALNANVFLELGIRTALDKPVAMIRDNTTRIPFDIGPISALEYDASLYGPTFHSERAAIALHLEASMENPGRNELWHHFGITKAALAPPEGTPQEGTDLMLRQILAAIQAGPTVEAKAVKVEPVRFAELTEKLRAMEGVTSVTIENNQLIVHQDMDVTMSLNSHEEISREAALVAVTLDIPLRYRFPKPS